MLYLRLHDNCESIQFPTYFCGIIFALITMPTGNVAPIISSHNTITRNNTSQWREFLYLNAKKDSSFVRDDQILHIVNNNESDNNSNNNNNNHVERRTTLKNNRHNNSSLLGPRNFQSDGRELIRNRRQSDTENVDKCRLFVEGDVGKNEIYSPDYPNNYPKNINCTRVITAPQGQIIRLDFRNYFHIEAKEECKFDFLEIRDGQYGFSNLIGRYCGTDFPPEITSKERYLWLHFHSDESIEYAGFTAVYEFIDRNRDAPSTDLNCTIEKFGYEGFVNSSDVPMDIRDIVIKNKIPLDCMWRIEVQVKWKIQVKFLDFKLSKPNDCETNFLDIFPEQTIMPLRIKNFCGSAGEGITSDSNILHMRFFADHPLQLNSSFAILYTAFRDRGSAACYDDEYDCEDATCISKELQCNGRDNCKFRWDEEGCAIESSGQSEHVIIIIVVFALILGGMLITFIINCVRKIMHDQKIIREHIRQSKESKLDEVGRRIKMQQRETPPILAPQGPKESTPAVQIFGDIVSHKYDDKEAKQSTKASQKDEDQCAFIAETNNHNYDAKPSGRVCDMSCQTRESLFLNASGDSKANLFHTARLSTFGTEVPKKTKGSPDIKSIDTAAESQVPLQASRMVSNLHHQPEICHHHHHRQHKEHREKPHQLQQSQILIPIASTLDQNFDAPTSNVPHRQPVRSQGKAKIIIDNRSSAPDVIIMTSH